jgi:hypothetical protein
MATSAINTSSNNNVLVKNQRRCNQNYFNKDLTIRLAMIDFRDILKRLKEGKIGMICRINKFIKIISYGQFNLRRHEQGNKRQCEKLLCLKCMN